MGVVAVVKIVEEFHYFSSGSMSKIGDIVGVLKLGGNSVLDFKLDFKEYAGIGDLWTYEISHYSEEYIHFEVNNKQYFMVLNGDCLIFPINNWEELHEIYRFGKIDGQLCLKSSIENLLKRY